MRLENLIIIAYMKHKHGYSLIEVLITLAIIAILATVPYPLYTHHIMSAHRKHAELILLSLAQQMENYYRLHGNYQKATLASLKVDTSNDPYYEFMVRHKGDQHYLLTAQPIKSQVNDECGLLEINDSGERKALGQERFNCW